VNGSTIQMRSIQRLLTGALLVAAGLIGPSIATAQDSASKPAVDAKDLPKAEAIIEKYVDATGGKAAYEKRETLIITSAIEIAAQGIKGKATAYQTKANKSYTVLEFDGIGKIEEGYDGKTAWETNPMAGPRIKDGDELELAVRTATFNGELHWKKLYKSAETVGLEDVEGKPAFKLKLTPNKGNDEFQFYDKESGLLVKNTAKINTQMGEMPIETLFSDYQATEGVKTPHKVVQKVGGGMQTLNINIEKVEVNAKIDADRFDLPKEVKELLDKPKADDKKDAKAGEKKEEKKDEKKEDKTRNKPEEPKKP